MYRSPLVTSRFYSAARGPYSGTPPGPPRPLGHLESECRVRLLPGDIHSLQTGRGPGEARIILEKVCASAYIGGVAKYRMVQDIEGIDAELNAALLPYFEILLH